MLSTLPERLSLIRQTIEDATRRAGRSPGEVDLLAVSKTFPPDLIREAADAGQRLFGESRVQECLEKIPMLPAGLVWHFIGHLQSNKIRKILPLCDTLHSVDSLDLALEMDRIAEDLGLRPKVFLQVNVAGEARKFGFSAQSILQQIETLLGLRRVEVIGLMTIPPLVKDPAESRPHFAALRELRDQLVKDTGAKLPGLSMGMSNDFETAISEGATIVRVGSNLFGGR